MTHCGSRMDKHNRETRRCEPETTILLLTSTRQCIITILLLYSGFVPLPRYWVLCKSEEADAFWSWLTIFKDVSFWASFTNTLPQFTRHCHNTMIHSRWILGKPWWGVKYWPVDESRGYTGMRSARGYSLGGSRGYRRPGVQYEYRTRNSSTSAIARLLFVNTDLNKMVINVHPSAPCWWIYRLSVGFFNLFWASKTIGYYRPKKFRPRV